MKYFSIVDPLREFATAFCPNIKRAGIGNKNHFRKHQTILFICDQSTTKKIANAYTEDAKIFPMGSDIVIGRQAIEK